jgi:hypothetical protein
MKPKYVFYLMLLLVMHYEVGRLVTNTQTSQTDESSYEHSTSFTPGNNVLQFKPVPEFRVYRVHNHPKKKHRLKSKNI